MDRSTDVAELQSGAKKYTIPGISGWLKTRQAKRTFIGYIFISPFILGVLFFVLIPTLVAAWLVFQDWNLISTPRYVGFENIVRLGTDSVFWQSVKVTTIYTIVAVPLGLIFSFFLALLINQPVRGIAIFRTIFYMPSLTPAVAAAVLWAWIFHTEFGLMNAALYYVGLPKIRWLQEPEWALSALIIMSLWGVGAAMIIFLAGLQSIPDSLYEASKIDGAGRYAQLRHITVPLMTPSIFFNLIIGIIYSFQVFTAALLITQGGPQNGTMFLVLYLYRVGYRFLEMGYAAALSWVLFFIVLVCTFFMFKILGQRVHYQ